MTMKGGKLTEETKRKMSIARKGKKLSDATREKIRQSLMGHPMSEETKRKLSEANRDKRIWNKGKTWPDEIRKKISETNKAKGIEPRVKYNEKGANHPSWKGGRPKCVDCGKQLRAYNAERCKACVCKGEKAYNWKGGVRTEQERIRSSPEYRSWQRSVFERDNWTCQKTGQRGGRLQSHHIRNFSEYPDLRFNADNGITLSVESHNEFHKKYGKRNNSMEQIEEFLGRTIIIGLEWT